MMQGLEVRPTEWQWIPWLTADAPKRSTPMLPPVLSRTSRADPIRIETCGLSKHHD